LPDGELAIDPPRENKEAHNARACSVCPQFAPRINKEVAVGCGWIGWRVRVAKNHAGFNLSQSSRRDSAGRVV
jgi:hypothetical protein